jgi:hypothetical protein
MKVIVPDNIDLSLVYSECQDFSRIKFELPQGIVSMHFNKGKHLEKQNHLN